ncbi:MAG TPA: hypothetical protein ENJ13_06100 [Chromatiales bacterium]|nr:hypothetical protein [Chromatiales bacterium]
MNKKRLGILCSSVLLLGLASTAQATLFNRGGGMIYDDVLDITWLQDANYAVTSDYAAANNQWGQTRLISMPFSISMGCRFC